MNGKDGFICQKSIKPLIGVFGPLNSKGKLLINASYYSVDFGKHIKRPLLKSNGIFKPGLNRVITVFSNKNDVIDFSKASNLKGLIKNKEGC